MIWQLCKSHYQTLVSSKVLCKSSHTFICDSTDTVCPLDRGIWYNMCGKTYYVKENIGSQELCLNMKVVKNCEMKLKIRHRAMHHVINLLPFFFIPWYCFSLFANILSIPIYYFILHVSAILSIRVSYLASTLS